MKFTQAVSRYACMMYAIVNQHLHVVNATVLMCCLLSHSRGVSISSLKAMSDYVTVCF